MSFILRFSQQIFAFISVQLTLNLYGDSVYRLFNQSLFFYLILLSLQQSALNKIWTKKNIIVYDCISIIFFSLILIACSFYIKRIPFIVYFFLLARMMERYVYIMFLSEDKFNTGQIFSLFVIFLEICFMLISHKYSTFVHRIALSIIIFSFSSIMSFFFLLEEEKGKVINRESMVNYYKNIYIKNINISLYFVVCIFIIQIDKMLTTYITNVSNYFFCMNIANAIFGLLSVTIDKKKIQLSNNFSDTSQKEFCLFILFLIIAFFYWILLNKTNYIRAYFHVQNQELIEIISIFAINGATFVTMSLSTFFLIMEKMRLPLFVLFSAFLLKISLFLYLQNIVYVNIIIAIAILALSRFFLVKSDIAVV